LRAICGSAGAISVDRTGKLALLSCEHLARRSRILSVWRLTFADMTAAAVHRSALPVPIQGTFEELGTPLREVTFVVVDLETTGAAATDSITEVGAVKVRGGEVLGEFQTLVNPSGPIAPFVAVLTGITDLMVAAAPRIEAVLPPFLEFTKGTVLVAHNAPFDVGFLRSACQRHEYTWPTFDVVDTARLARRVLTRDEVPDATLRTLARYFRATTEPIHRALADARATVDVLHGLIERLGSYGVHSLEELAIFSARVAPQQVAKRHLAEGLPTSPGVYLFKDERGEVLYVGKSRNLRSRVRTYFTASETRTRITEMIGLAAQVTPIVCETALEAEVRELRLIAEHKPRYNRRSRFPERALWLKLTVEPFPRLSMVREVRDDATTYLGPFGSRRVAEQAMTALHEAFPIRQCTQRLSPQRLRSTCILYEMGRCNGPCEGHESVAEYSVHVAAARTAILGDVRPLVRHLTARIDLLAGQQRYEDAAIHRDRLAAFVRTAARMQRITALSGCRQLIAARPVDPGTRLGDRLGSPPTAQRVRSKDWELAVVRYGRLAAAGVMPPDAVPSAFVDALIATAETVRPGPGPMPAATAEETECVLRWLEAPGTRLVQLDGEWSWPAHGAASVHDTIDPGASGTSTLIPFDRPRRLRPVHRPAR
jgi:DNA polymerase-3 subunit epsilon